MNANFDYGINGDYLNFFEYKNIINTLSKTSLECHNF